MKYVGSKARFAKELVNIMIKDHDPNGLWYEPFVGGANMICEVPDHINRIGVDIDGDVINLLQHVSYGWIPPDDVSEAMYYAINSIPEYSTPEFVTFVAHCCSFGGKKWGGYARGNNDKGEPRNYASEQKRHLLKMAPKIRTVHFEKGDYTCMDRHLNEMTTVYCDPPYASVTGYKDKFNHEVFWGWVSRTAPKVGQMFVSEYNCPLPNAEVVWERNTKTMLAKEGSKLAVEKLFRITP